MVENFSSSYYLTQLDIEPYSGEYAVLQDKWFDYYQRKCSYTTPLIFRINNTHIPVYGESSVPPGLLALPSAVLDDLDLDDLVKRNVLVAKKHAVDTLVSRELV